MFKKVTIEYSSKRINKEVLANHICDIIINNHEDKEELVNYEAKENRCVA